MKPINIIKTLASLAAPLMLWGCSDDVFEKGFPSPGEEFEGIVLSIPNAVSTQNATRSASETRADATWESEAEINTLTILAYPQGSTSTTPVVTEFDADDLSSVNTATTYKQIPVVLPKGKYHIYVLANLDYSDLDKNTAWKSLTESDLKSATITGMDAGTLSDYSKGLPMSCNYTKLTKDGSEVFSSTDNVVEITSGMSTKVYAPLTFAVAKVRVTLLNDLNPSLKMASAPASLSNGATSVRAVESDRLTGNLHSSPETLSGKYVEMPTETVDATDTESDSETSIGSSSSWPVNANVDGLAEVETPGNIWAWQGVWYIPERLYNEDDTNHAAITLSFSDNSSKSLVIGTPATSGTSLTNPELTRSRFYDFIGNSNGEFTVKVKPWTLEELVYSLHGPYFLHVYETSVPVTAGETSELVYESDTQISCISPMYKLDDKEIPLYVFDTNDSNLIKISVNPELPQSEFETIMADYDAGKHTYDYFHIKAGNLYKKIDVKPLKLQLFLNVSRENLTIDVREIIASCSYNGNLLIGVTTNVPKVQIVFGENSDWDKITDAERAVYLSLEEGKVDNRINSKDVINITQGTTPIYVNYQELNSGWDFWKNKHTMTFEVIPLDGKGTEITDNDNVKRHTVTINVLPNIPNYIIHFKAQGWENPHIYVYQCLEFPADTKYANVPVAADANGDFASLEYSFTGKVAFKGWNVGEYNDPNQDSEITAHGFRYFKDDTKSWNWLEANAAHWKHYNDNMDFCSDYRNGYNDKGEYRCKCKVCRESEFARVWPGIMMEKEADEDDYEGWWKFELSGVATPGKALIMFSDKEKDCHDTREDSDGEIRYPADKQVGMPLFDYPNKEGWFEYIKSNNTHQFTSTSPKNRPPSTIYRLYWPKFINGVSYPYIWFNGDNTYDTAAHGEEQGDYYYYDFQPKLDWAEFLVKKTKSSNSGSDKYGLNNIVIPLENFHDDGNRLTYTWKP